MNKKQIQNLANKVEDMSRLLERVMAQHAGFVAVVDGMESALAVSKLMPKRSRGSSPPERLPQEILSDFVDGLERIAEGVQDTKGRLDREVERLERKITRADESLDDRVLQVILDLECGKYRTKRQDIVKAQERVAVLEDTMREIGELKDGESLVVEIRDGQIETRKPQGGCK